MPTISGSSALFAALIACVLIGLLHAAVFNVNIKQPSERQRQLHCAHQSAFAAAKDMEAKKTEAAKQLLHGRQRKQPPVGAAGDGESKETDDFDGFVLNWYWMNPMGAIKLGIPPQEFFVAFSPISPDTFVSQAGSVTWENFMSFNESKSYTFTSDGTAFRDSLLLDNILYDKCKNPNTGIVGKDMITFADTLVLPLKFGLVNNLSVQQCMPWNGLDVEGMFGMSLASSKNNGMEPTLKQLAPILDEPIVSLLTTVGKHYTDLQYHMRIGSGTLEGHCSTDDYTFFPSTSAFPKPEEAHKANGYNTKLWSLESRYANGSFARWNLPAETSIEFPMLVQYNPYSEPVIFGDAETVDAVTTQLGGGRNSLGIHTSARMHRIW